MAQSANINGSGNFIVQIKGDNNTVITGRPHLHLTRYFTRRQKDPSDRTLSDATLVSPYTVSIPMVGRGEVYDSLWRWLDADRAASIRVLVGNGGRGKTRLALELCDAAAAKGWQAGFATRLEMTRFQGQQNLASWGWQKPTLIVVDYVASQTAAIHKWLVELAGNEALMDPATGQEKPMRVLLLERQADPEGGWWRDVFGAGGGDARAVRELLDPAAPVPLPPVEDPERRWEVLSAMLERAGSDLRPPAVGADEYFDNKLAALSWGGEPLFLMMAGLLAAKAGFAHVLALSGDDLALEIAKDELSRIGGIAETHGVPRPFAEHLAAMVTLCQGLDRDTAFDVIEAEKAALGYDGAGDRATIFTALRTALPDPDNGLEPVLPDIVGEALLVQVWRRGGPDGVAAVVRALAHAPDTITPTVIRTCQDFAVHGHVAPLAWLDALGEDAAKDLPLLLALLDELPQQTLALRERAVGLTEIAVAAFRRRLAADGETSDAAGLATNLNNLSNRLADVGRREDALAAIEQAVAIHHELAAARPDAFRPDLAMSLNNLCRAAWTPLAAARTPWRRSSRRWRSAVSLPPPDPTPSVPTWRHR